MPDNQGTELEFSLALIHPFTALLIGPSGCGELTNTDKKCCKIYFFLGKSELILKILLDENSIKEKPERIYWFYGVPQNSHQYVSEQVKKVRGIDIDFREGLKSFDLNEFDAAFRNLIILDDLYTEIKDSLAICGLFFKGSHHRSISVLATQNVLFPRGKISKDIAVNTKYLFVFRNRPDMKQFSYLAQQLEPTRWRFLLDAYNQETSQAFRYLLIDLTNTVPEILRYRTGVGSYLGHVYVPKQSSINLPLYIKEP